MLYPSAVPCILSACLVSLEPDSVLRLMPDQFTPDERFSQVSVNSQLSTPQDVSCTHILVFPTSATTQSSQTAFQVGFRFLSKSAELISFNSVLFFTYNSFQCNIYFLQLIHDDLRAVISQRF